ncbi:hypothetical protein [Kitasatospora sp. KL5]|uniref:hypothetical protein n=1 Tax=Kitasatospora sp. KL5 TaxID=3425125 RepID=UPI003D6F74DF
MRTVARLSQAVSRGLDDLALGPDGYLYTVGHYSGELLHVDPRDGSHCVLATGLLSPTGVRFGKFPGEDPRKVLYLALAPAASCAPGSAADSAARPVAQTARSHWGPHLVTDLQGRRPGPPVPGRSGP